MPAIKTYNSEGFRNEYFNASPELERLFQKSVEDFFCLRIEDISERVLKPIRPSREESHTLLFITESAYKTKIGFQEYSITPNQIVILQAGAVFSTPEISTSVKGFACHFHPDVLIGKFGNGTLISEFEFLNVGTHPIIEVTPASKLAIQNNFERLCQEFKSDGTPNAMIVHSYLYTLLAEMKILFGDGDTTGQNASFQITTQFKKLAHQQVKQQLSIADFAKQMNISPNHLNKSVKHITSKPASVIYDEIKLIEIKFLLYQTDLSISQIAYEMGFLDPSYFTRFFKKLTNTTPSEFRELIE